VSAAAEQAQGPKFFIDIEGEDHPWDEPTITTEQIRALAGWSAEEQVLEVNLENNTESTLADGATIELKPGKGFGKKVRFQRG